MLSQTAEYALRAVVCLARDADRPLTTDALAAEAGMPRGYLAKVLQQLGRAGIVTSHRGLHGGFALARLTEELTLLDVVNSVDPLPSISSCPIGGRNHGDGLCPLHHTLQRANVEVARILAATTIAALASGPNGLAPLCEAVDEKGT